MNLIDHAYLSDEEFIKTVFSSGDYFPGFYRYNLGPRIVRGEQLTLAGVMRILANPTRTYPRSVWLRDTLKFYEDIEHRDLAHGDVATYRMMRKSYREWMLEASTYGLICIDILARNEEIMPDESYFFMGSVVRYGNDKVEIGLDHFRKNSTYVINYDTDKFHSWINKIYEGSHQDLFLPARVIGEVSFSEDYGTLNVEEESLIECMTFTEPVVFASNYDRNYDLPIRWAKDIVLSEVVP